MPTFDENIGRIYVCAGHPHCDYDGSGDSSERQRNCPFCLVEAIDINGVWHVIRKPSEC